MEGHGSQLAVWLSCQSRLQGPPTRAPSTPSTPLPNHLQVYRLVEVKQLAVEVGRLRALVPQPRPPRQGKAPKEGAGAGARCAYARASWGGAAPLPRLLRAWRWRPAACAGVPSSLHPAARSPAWPSTQRHQGACRSRAAGAGGGGGGGPGGARGGGAGRAAWAAAPAAESGDDSDRAGRVPSAGSGVRLRAPLAKQCLGPFAGGLAGGPAMDAAWGGRRIAQRCRPGCVLRVAPSYPPPARCLCPAPRPPPAPPIHPLHSYPEARLPPEEAASVLERAWFCVHGPAAQQFMAELAAEAEWEPPPRCVGWVGGSTGWHSRPSLHCCPPAAARQGCLDMRAASTAASPASPARLPPSQHPAPRRAAARRPPRAPTRRRRAGSGRWARPCRAGWPPRETSWWVQPGWAPRGARRHCCPVLHIRALLSGSATHLPTHLT